MDEEHKPTEQELEIQKIFFNALKPVIHGLKPENISVREVCTKPETFQPLLDQWSEGMQKQGTSMSNSVMTSITFKDIDVDIDNIDTLRHIVSGTGVHVTYSSDGIDFLGSAETMLKLLDVPKFNQRVRQNIQPDGRGAA